MRSNLAATPALERGARQRLRMATSRIRADGGAGAAVGDVAVDVLDKAQALGEVAEGRGGAEVAHEGARGGHGGGIGALGNDVVDAAAEPSLDNLGAVIDARRLAHVVIGLALNGLADETGHGLGHSIAYREHHYQGMFQNTPAPGLRPDDSVRNMTWQLSLDRHSPRARHSFRGREWIACVSHGI